MVNNQFEKIQTDEEIEIDLRELLFRIRKRFFIILIVTLLGGGIGYSFSKYVLTPIYTSTSMIYVISKETTLTSLADLTIGAQLTEDYKVLVTSRTVMEGVIDKLNLNLDYHRMVDKITIDNPRNTRILQINVKDADPVLAKKMADATALSASDYIADIMEQNPPKIIEFGEVPQLQTSPSVRKNSIVAALIAFALSIGLITLSLIMDDTIKTEDDIEKRFNLPVIAVVPEIDGDGSKKGRKKKKKTKKVSKGAKIS